VAIREDHTGTLVFLVHVSPASNLPAHVTAGTRVGVNDRTGKMDAPHLHFAVKNNQGDFVNPATSGFLENCGSRQ
jgi:hypothetical protein